MTQALLHYPALGVVVFLVLFVSDSLLTVYATRLYRNGANEVIILEGSYELNPASVNEVESLRCISPRFVAMLAFYSLAILGMWYLSVHLSWFPPAYSLFIGAIVLPQGPILIRHVRNILAFRHVARGDDITGRIHYSRAFSYRLSSIELASFSALYLVLAGLSGSLLLLGGSIGTALLAFRGYQWSRSA